MKKPRRSRASFHSYEPTSSLPLAMDRVSPDPAGLWMVPGLGADMWRCTGPRPVGGRRGRCRLVRHGGVCHRQHRIVMTDMECAVHARSGCAAGIFSTVLQASCIACHRRIRRLRGNSAPGCSQLTTGAAAFKVAPRGQTRKNAAPRYAKTGRRRVTRVDAVQKIPTKCGAELLRIFRSPRRAGGRFFRGVIFSWDFFSVPRP